MQNAGIAALGLDWRYTAAEVRPEQLREAIAGAQAMHYIGLNLTVPHKLLALDMVDVQDESAREWGAVNTILFEGQNENGDWRALMNSIPPRITCVATDSTPMQTPSRKAYGRISVWKCAARKSCCSARAEPDTWRP